MKSFDTLIRLAKSEVDEAQRALSAVQDRMDALDQEQISLDQLRDTEREKAEQDAAAAPLFGHFLTLYKQKTQDIGERKLALEPELEEARDILAQAFETQKRYEITRDQRKAAEVAEQKAKDQKLQDELGMVLHRRRQARENGR